MHVRNLIAIVVPVILIVHLIAWPGNPLPFDYIQNSQPQQGVPDSRVPEPSSSHATPVEINRVNQSNDPIGKQQESAAAKNPNDATKTRHDPQKILQRIASRSVKFVSTVQQSNESSTDPIDGPAPVEPPIAETDTYQTDIYPNDTFHDWHIQSDDHSPFGIHQHHTAPASHAFDNHPAMDVHRFGLCYYRNLMLTHAPPHPSELQGAWRGVNKGIATLAIDRYFIKEFQYFDGQLFGDNVSVHQPDPYGHQLPNWQPVFSHSSSAHRTGNFRVENSGGIGPFRHGLVLNYGAGGNPPLDPANLIVDRLVKLDDHHMLGRATVKLGLVPVPVSYFVLQRISH